MALTFFKTPRNKQFNYRPVFYDKKKEEREKRLTSALDQNKEGAAYEEALRERMQMRWKRTSGARSRKASNQRLIIILFVIALVMYLIWFI